MDSDIKDFLKVLAIPAGMVFVAVAVALLVGWYQAGVQRDVYDRQGCSMTQWEVFMGAKPIVRNLGTEEP